MHRKPGHMLDSDAATEKGILQFIVPFPMKLTHTVVDLKMISLCTLAKAGSTAKFLSSYYNFN